MKEVSMYEAKTHLSKLVDLALAGEQVVISRRDRPLVQLVPVREPSKKRRIGGLPDVLKRMGDDFNAPMDDWEPSILSGGVPKAKRSSGTRSGKNK